MSVRRQVIWGIWPAFILLPLVAGLFEYRIQIVESRWGQQEQVAMLARSLAEMARTDSETWSRFQSAGSPISVPVRVQEALRRLPGTRAVAWREAGFELAFGAVPTTEPPPSLGELRRRVGDSDQVWVKQSATQEWQAWASVSDGQGIVVGYVLTEMPDGTHQVSVSVWRKVVWQTAGSGLAGLLMCLALGTFVRRELRRVQVPGELDLEAAPAQASGSSGSRIMEVGDLGNAFDTMHSVLREAVDRARRAEETVPTEASLMLAFAEEFLGDEKLEGAGRRVEVRRAGLAAGHFQCLDRDGERCLVVLAEVEAAPGLSAQVAADAAGQFLRSVLPQGLAQALTETAGLYPLRRGMALECVGVGDAAICWRYEPGSGWTPQTASVAGRHLILHTLAEPEAVRDLLLYARAFTDAESSGLAADLVRLLAGRHEGLVAVVTPENGQGMSRSIILEH
jgi:hypothetical protein